MAIVASVKELTEFQNKKLAKSFAGILQSVVPDVTKSLAKAAKAFSKSLISPTNKNIQNTYGNLKTFLNNFDVSISDLGSGFKDVEEAFKGLTKQFADVDDYVEKLREKNIFAESRLIVNKKNNNLEVKAIILTDQELFKKREALLKEEKDLKAEEKKYLAQIRKLESGKIQMDDSDRADLSQNLQDNLGKQENVRGEIGKYQGKGGSSSIGVVDKFERFLADRGPSFLQNAFAPILSIARDFEKTISLMVSGIKKTANFLLSLPNLFKKGFGFLQKGFGSLGKMLVGLRKNLAVVGAGLLMFTKRVFMAGLALILAIVTPLLPLIIPLLEFAVVIGAVVAGLYLLKKGVTVLADWFRNSWLGKKLGLDKESMAKAEVKDKKEGTGKYQSLDGEMDYGDHYESNKKDKVIIEKPLMPANTGDASVAEKAAKDNKSGNETVGGKYNFQDGVLQQNGENFETKTPQKAEMLAKKIGDQVKVARNNETGKYVIVKKDMVTAERPDTKIMQGATGDIEGVIGSNQDKFKKPDTIKKDLKGAGTSSSSTTTTVVNNQPSSSNTQVANTNMFTPINTSSGDSYFDRQANASNF